MEGDAIAAVRDPDVLVGRSFDAYVLRGEPSLYAEHAARASLARMAVAHRDSNGYAFRLERELSATARSFASRHDAIEAQIRSIALSTASSRRDADRARQNA